MEYFGRLVIIFHTLVPCYYSVCQRVESLSHWLSYRYLVVSLISTLAVRRQQSAQWLNQTIVGCYLFNVNVFNLAALAATSVSSSTTSSLLPPPPSFIIPLHNLQCCTLIFYSIAVSSKALLKIIGWCPFIIKFFIRFYSRSNQNQCKETFLYSLLVLSTRCWIPPFL